MNASALASFAPTLLKWQTVFGRHHLPWSSRDPYKVWVSELMLQQTQVTTVLRYYEPFLARFPTLADLANSSLDEVYSLWSGLGYYRRARFLHEGARHIMLAHDGLFPSTLTEVLKLPGVGPSTAHAILAFCFRERLSILDGNVQRTLARWSGSQENLKSPSNIRTLWALAEACLPTEPDDMPQYTQALMDFGSLQCIPKSPECSSCPLQSTCLAFLNGWVDQIPLVQKTKSKPIRFGTFDACVRRQNGREEIGFVRYHEHGVWDNLFGPPLTFPTESVLNISLTHVFSHFKAHFSVQYLSADTFQTDLVWRTREEWLGLGIPTPVRTLMPLFFSQQ
jgi:A/G-specific adenine glycosylase